jgi:hypothetical protein
VTADDGLAWVGVAPLLLDDVGDGAAVGTLDADAGVEPEQRYAWSSDDPKFYLIIQVKYRRQ